MRYKIRVHNPDNTISTVVGFRTERSATEYANRLIAAMDTADARESLVVIEPE